METKNLLLRNTELSDCKCFYHWEKDPAIIEDLSIDKDIQYEDVFKDFVLDSIDPDMLMFTILSKTEN